MIIIITTTTIIIIINIISIISEIGGNRRSSGRSALLRQRATLLGWPDQQGKPHVRESRILAPVGPRMQAAGLQCLKLQIAVAFPNPQTSAFPDTEVSRKTWSPNSQGGSEIMRGQARASASCARSTCGPCAS